MRWASGLTLVLVLGSGSLRAQEGGIEIFAGETLFESGWRASMTEIYKPKRDLYSGSHRMGDPLNRSTAEWRTVLGLDYGLDRDATISALVPFVYRDIKAAGDRANTSGLGDIALLGKYRILKEEGQQESFNWAIIGGLEIPTGATDQEANGMRIAAKQQVGRGAWNPFLASSITYGKGRARFDTTIFYKFNTEGDQKYESGDFFSLSVSAAYRFIHYQYPGATAAARLGLQWRHEARDHSHRQLVANSGADQLLLNPALSFHPVPNMDLNLGLRIPLYQTYKGQQLGRDVEFIAALGFRF